MGMMSVCVWGDRAPFELLRVLCSDAERHGPGEGSVLPCMENVPKHGYLDSLPCDHNKGLEKERVDRKAFRSSKEFEKCKAIIIGLCFLSA